MGRQDSRERAKKHIYGNSIASILFVFTTIASLFLTTPSFEGSSITLTVTTGCVPAITTGGDSTGPVTGANAGDTVTAGVDDEATGEDAVADDDTVPLLAATIVCDDVTAVLLLVPDRGLAVNVADNVAESGDGESHGLLLLPWSPKYDDDAFDSVEGCPPDELGGRMPVNDEGDSFTDEPDPGRDPCRPPMLVLLPCEWWL